MATGIALCYYEKAGVGVTGLTATATVYQVALADLAHSAIVSAQTMTEIGGGLYAYRLTSLDFTLYWYPFTTTTAGDVDTATLAGIVHDFGQVEMDAYNVAKPTDIINDGTPFSGADIDAAISTRGTADPGDAMMLTVAEREAIDTVLSLVHGADSWSATGGSDVVSVLNAIRNKTDRIGTGRAIMVSPVTVDGTVRIVKGDAYYDTDGRRLEWSDEEWNIIDTSVLVMIIHGETTFVATRLSATSVGLELSSVQTLALDAGNMRYSLQEITVGGDTISRVHDAPMYIASQPLPVYAP